MTTEGIGTVVTALSSIGLYPGVRDDDVVDRMNHLVMYGLMVVLAIGSGAKQFVGDPIFCWVPTQFKEKWHKRFFNHYCWVNPLYHVAWEDTVPVDVEKRFFNDVGFYRWATIFFIVQAVMFKIPHFLWRELKNFSGVRLEKLAGMTLDTALMSQTERDKKLGWVAEYIHMWIRSQRDVHKNPNWSKARRVARSILRFLGKRSGRFLVFIYLFIKFLYLLNTIGQFFIVSIFLDMNFWKFGIEATRSYTSEGEFTDDNNFPRIALCDVNLRQMNNLHTYSIQCVLTINLFLEKMFIFQWFCLVCLFILNLFSFINWSYNLLSEKKTIEFLLTYSGSLVRRKSNDVTKQEQKMFLNLAKKYLRHDGIFIIRMIAANTTELLTLDLVRQIWKRYRKFLTEEQNMGYTRTKSVPNGSFENTYEKEGTEI